MLTDQVIGPIIEGVSNTYGEQFFNRMVELLGKTSRSDFCFVAEVDEVSMQASTLALFANGQLADNFCYPLADSPCEQVMCSRDSVYPAGVAGLFPKDQLLEQMGIEGYIGASLKDVDGRLLGIVVALYQRPVEEPEPIHTIFQLFTGRIAAEIARSHKADELSRANAELEQRVKARTLELEQALAELKESQQRLIEQEKFASLGNLVAGVAHEVNTPLGIGVTSTSVIRSILSELTTAMAEKKLTESAMNHALQELDEVSIMLEQNLDRAAKLVQDFKQIAVNNANLDIEVVNLQSLVHALLSSLHPETRKHAVDIQTDIPFDLVFESYPGDLSQLLSNLLLNSLIYGYPEGQSGHVSLSAQRDGDRLKLVYSDDGVGISEAHRAHIYEPFFTTRRHQGGCGLGLNIVYNIVTQKLGGQILQSTPAQGGCRYDIEFPINSCAT